MTIQQCKWVIEIAKLGSFNEASKQLFISQSALSSAVKKLEDELGVQIFERSKNGVCLSPDGAEFIRYAEQLVKQSEFIQNRYERPEDCKKLHVATQHYDFVADAFCTFLRECDEQNYNFSIRELKTYDVIKEVERAFCDVGVLAIKDGDFEVMQRYLSSKEIRFTEFLCAKPHVYVSKNHPLASQSKVKFSDLIDYPYVCYEQGSHEATFFTEELVANYKASKQISISDRATLMNVLLSTNAYTVGTGVMPSALNNGKIISVKLESDSFYRIGYICRYGADLFGLQEKFIQTLKLFASNFCK